MEGDEAASRMDDQLTLSLAAWLNFNPEVAHQMLVDVPSVEKEAARIQEPKRNVCGRIR